MELQHPNEQMASKNHIPVSWLVTCNVFMESMLFILEKWASWQRKKTDSC